MLKLSAGKSGLVRAFLLTGTAVAALHAPAALAQDEDGADDQVATQEAGSGNEIVVTATKREQTLQEVPVAVTVTTAETLERGQIRDIKDLQTVVPSLIVGQRQSLAATNFFIRGFGNGANNPGIEPSVGVFVDGVYRSRTVAQVTDLPDVQRIEVLRGPQSTLFGKNASAGVISISTQKPSFTLGGSAELTYGNYDALVGKAHITGPISENFAFSVAGGFNTRDGFFKDVGTGHRTNERDRWFARGQLLFEGDSGLSVRVIGDYDKIDENCCGVVNLKSGPTFGAVLALGGATNDPNDPFSRVVSNNFDSTNEIENYGISGQVDFDLGPGSLTSITAWRKTNSLAVQDPDFTSADLVYPFLQETGIKTFTQEVRWTGEVAPGLDLLIGAFYLSDNVGQQENLLYSTQFRPYANILVQGATGGALNVPLLEQTFGALEGNPAKYVNTFFQPGTGFRNHFNLKSESISVFGQLDFEITDGLTLTLGGNYANDWKKFRTDAVSNDTFSAIDFNAPQYAPFRYNLLYGGALSAGVGQALGLGRSATPAEIFAFATGASPAGAAGAAAYANVIVPGATAYATANANNPLANPLNALKPLQFLPPFLNLPNSVEPGKTHDDNFSYTIRLAYDIDPSLNVYASYATGFKASSVNLSRDSRPFASDRTALEAAGLTVANQTYGSRFAGPEKSRVIEAGLKYNDNGLSANVAVFKQQIKGFQSNLFTGTGFALLNAGKQSTFGIELETQASLGDLTLNFATTYLDPKYDSFNSSAVGNLTGTKPAGIPKWTVVMGAQYELQVGPGNLIPRVSYLYASKAAVVEGLPGFLVRGPDGSIIDNTAALAAAKPFTVTRNDLTASIDYEFENGLSIGIWGRNLLKDNNIETIFDSVAQSGGISGYINDPRTYGITGRFRF
ncbi:TonB-dependent receptor [Altererythrobacter salegens]|uniref:TonB-dependent receptor n=1 Tax=Croceibacterium salegens TaxID=1737568 RepID=A0A6I4SU31_9SPHN|nr:TonB-dependent receptor [Croceibacterium salegens]MXO57982.1 TonB-dependent receptor [Croceibacterium salegens]